MSLVHVWHPLKLQSGWEERYQTNLRSRYFDDPEARGRPLFIPPREAETPIRDLIPLGNEAVLATHWNWCTLLWRALDNSGIAAYSPQGLKSRVYCSALTPKQPCLIQGMSDGTIAFMALKEPFQHVPFHVMESKMKSVFRLAVSPDERFLLATDNSEHVFLYELDLSFLSSPNIGPEEWTMNWPELDVHEVKPNMAVQCLTFTPDSKYFISSSHQSKKLVLCDASKGKVVQEKTFDDHLGAAAVMPNGDYLALDSDSRTRFLELPSLNEMDSIKYAGWESSCTSIALSPDGKYLVTPSYSMLTLWNLETGKMIGEFQTKPSHDDFGPQSKYPSPKEPVETIAFLPDGKHLVSGGEMGGLNLWDLSQLIP
ncbi:MAG: WD40 repeat domain-containing protein [Promethearchaeati archaeon SRVP18_Atabeyarchaeia-1]